MSHVLSKSAVSLAALILAGCGAAAQTTAPAQPPPTVNVAEVAFKTLPQWDDFTGRLEAVDTVDDHEDFELGRCRRLLSERGQHGR